MVVIFTLVHYLICPQTFVKGHHKVGVLRVKQGQRSEEDIFCNEHEPGPFDQFLRVLGKESYTYPRLHMAASWSIEVLLNDWCLPSCLSAGDRVKLQGFKGFLGGLDSERDLTGESSVFAKFQGLDVMFHVSTLIPFTPNDPQQVRQDGTEL